MKLFLLGMLVMYLLVGILSVFLYDSDEFYNILYCPITFTIAMLAYIIIPLTQPKKFIWVVRHHKNPWTFTRGKLNEMPEKEKNDFHTKFLD